VLTPSWRRIPAEEGKDAGLSAVVLPQRSAPPRAWRELWLITIGHGLTHWYPATFYLLLPLIGAALGLSYSQIGLIMTCKYIASAVANVPGGVLVDTVGRKGLLMAVSLFWIGFPYLLIGFTGSYVMLLACVALVGFGNSLWHPPFRLGRRYPERKGLGLHGGGQRRRRGRAGDHRRGIDHFGAKWQLNVAGLDGRRCSSLQEPAPGRKESQAETPSFGAYSPG
jgi:hypothetical protein